MKRFRYLLIAASLGVSGNVFACSIFLPPPNERFEGSKVVVLAVPTAISFRPREAAKPSYEGSFKQTVLWQVLISWKGSYRAGNTFTTRQEFSSGAECTSQFPVYSNAPQLLYLRGKEPYAFFYHSSPARSVQDFQYLELVRRP